MLVPIIYFLMVWSSRGVGGWVAGMQANAPVRARGGTRDRSRSRHNGDFAGLGLGLHAMHLQLLDGMFTNLSARGRLH